MVLIIISLISIYLCFKWSNWKNWKAYYPTVLFYIIANFNHELLTPNNDLWLIRDYLWNDTLADYFISFAIAPFIIIFYLSNYPKRKTKQVGYILLFTVIFSLIEYISLTQKWLTYYRGWDMFWTVLVYISTFVLIPIHYKKPLWAWLIFLGLVLVVIFHFNISLWNLR